MSGIRRRNDSRSSFRSRVSYRSIASEDGQETVERGHWNSKADYLFTCIGYAVGLGNICRFPYLTYENGGGAFVIPYIVMLLLVGIPIVFMETSLGQYSGKGPIKVWSFCPVFGGVGIAQIVLVFYVGIYYNVIVSYSIFFLFSSLDSTVPWGTCDNWWNTQNCRANSGTPVIGCHVLGTSLIEVFQTKAYEAFQAIEKATGKTAPSGEWILYDEDIALLPPEISRTLESEICRSTLSSTPAEEYMEQYVLGISKSIGFFADPVRWQNTIVFALSWFLIFIVLMKGIKEAGKIIWFTALFPYVVLTIFLIRGATLDGASMGLKYYLGSESDFAKLGRGATWKNAATQILFSTSAAQGGMITLASYSNFNNNNLQDTFIITVVNSLTSLYGGLSVFCVLGFMAKRSNTELSKVVRSGITLAFVSFPAAIAEMPGSVAWSCIFFFMVLLLGLDTQFTVVEICTTAIMDYFPGKIKPGRDQQLLTASLCFIFFILGLPLMTGSGIYWIVLMDDFAGSWGLIIIALIEVIAIAWVYGADNFIENIKEMLPEEKTFGLDLKNSRANWIFWKIMWQYVTPVTLFVILIWSLIDIKPSQYGNHIFPPWAQAIGWLLLFSGLIFIFIVAIYKINYEFRKSGDFKAAIIASKKPDKNWKPNKPANPRPIQSRATAPYASNRATSRMESILEETARSTPSSSFGKYQAGKQFFNPKPMASPMV